MEIKFLLTFIVKSATIFQQIPVMNINKFKGKCPSLILAVLGLINTSFTCVNRVNVSSLQKS